MKKLTLSLAAIGTLSLLALMPTHAQIIITEVDASGSSSTYASDWFEVTNKGASSVSLSGWKMDDNSNSFGLSVAMSGVTSLAAGESAIFMETSSSATFTAFKTAWFGSNAPAALQFGMYSGSGVGLSTSGDAVNLFNSSGVLQSGVSFGAASATATFDNSGGTTATGVTLSTFSSVGVNGAFTAANTTEVGSPGLITAAVPEPSSGALAALVAGAFAFCAWRRKAARA